MKKLMVSLVTFVMAFFALAMVNPGEASAKSDATAAPNTAATTSASADATNCTVQGLAQLCINEQKVSFSTVSFTDKEAAFATVSTTAKGVLLVRPFRLNSGIPKKKCQWFKGGVNTYLDARGRQIPIREKVKVYACPDKSSPSGWRKRGGGRTMKDCWNVYYPPGKPHPPLYKGKVKIVLSFDITATVRLRANINAKASATASCVVPGASAFSTATGTGSAFVLVTGRASAKSRSQAHGQASSRARLSTNQTADLMLTASKQASVELTASARAVCTAVVPPTPTPTPPTPTPTPTPPTPAAHSCTVTPILEKDGRLVRLLIATDTNGPVTTVNWGDGTTSSNAGLNPSRQYGSDNTWTITVSIKYNDGGSATCSTSVKTNAAASQPPPAPATAPGPNPPNTGSASCPPGWKPDPTNPATGCVPA
ncbi:MAG: hypothetical protein WD887_02625 [Candidatus Saccharimonadales bacterium]